MPRRWDVDSHGPPGALPPPAGTQGVTHQHREPHTFSPFNLQPLRRDAAGGQEFRPYSSTGHGTAADVAHCCVAGAWDARTPAGLTYETGLHQLLAFGAGPGARAGGRASARKRGILRVAGRRKTASWRTARRGPPLGDRAVRCRDLPRVQLVARAQVVQVGDSAVRVAPDAGTPGRGAPPAARTDRQAARPGHLGSPASRLAQR